LSIELKKVSKRFVDNVVLNEVDFFVAEGETVALLGPSGVGKSVLLKHIIGLIKPDSGEVWVDGQLVPTLGRRELATLRSRIGYVFQNGALFDSMDVFENIRLGITDDTAYADKDYCIERVKECLRLVNLPVEVGRKFPSELSGGMRKRVGIARAIPVNADIIDSLIERLQQEIGVTSVVVTHDVRGAFRVADRIALLAQAKIRAVGTAEEIIASKDPVVQQFLERDLEMAVIQANETPGSK